MEEDDIRFWIIPIICIVAVSGIFTVILIHRFSVEIPNAKIELAEMKTMTCDEIQSKVSLNKFWSLDNQAFARQRDKGCADATSATKQAEKEKLDKLLADPNSLESLYKDLKSYQKLYDSFKERYDNYSKQAAILKQNVTDFENKINEINSTIQEKYGANQAN